MLTSEQEIQEIANRVRPDQTLDSKFNILSSIESQNLKIEYTAEKASTEVTGSLNIANRTIKLAPLHKTNASSIYCLSYFLGAALLLNKEEITSISASNNIITTAYTKNDIALEQTTEIAVSTFVKFLLMPKTLTTRLIHRLINDFDIKDHNHGPIYLDYQECNHSQYVKIINNICSIMNVHSALAISRLIELELLNDVRLIKPKNWSAFVNDPNKNSPRDAKSPQRVNITLTR